MASNHGSLTVIHVPYNFSFADAAARAAGTGYTIVPGDVGKFARQLDTNAIYMLTDDSPITWIAISGAGGSGDSTLTSVYASRPAASNDGNLFLPSDGFVIERDTGSVYAPWGPISPFTAPVDASYSWINQTSASVTATVSTTNGGIHLASALTTSGLNNRLRVKSIPTVPYVITAAFLLGFDPYGSNATARVVEAGLCFRASGTGEIQTFVVSYSKDSNITLLLSRKWTSPTAFSADYVSFSTTALGLMFQNVIWLRIADDNTNRICSVSGDGVNFFTFHSIGRTNFLTADQVGFVLRNDSTAGSNGAAGMTLLSWKET